MREYRYILDKSSKKFICPICNKKKLVRFIDTETNEYLEGDFGRCDDEHFFQAPKEETKGYFVPIDAISLLNNKCTILHQDKKEYLVPTSVILENNPNGVYIANYFLNDIKNNRKKPIEFRYDLNQSKYFNNGVATYVSNKIYEPKINKIVHFDFDTFKETLNVNRYSDNIFLNNLLKLIDVEDVTRIVELYRLGTINKGYMKGALTIPFIDKLNNVRAIQVKQFDENNHTTKTTFLHSIIESHYIKNGKELPQWINEYKDQDKRITCFFGEHLLSMFPNNPIGLVEAPKTAIICSLYFGLPKSDNEIIWLAVYNKSSFTFDKLRSLNNRKVFVFPDLSKDGETYNEWKEKTMQFTNEMPGTTFSFSKFLENVATNEEKEKGLDIADYLIKYNYKEFNKCNLDLPKV